MSEKKEKDWAKPRKVSERVVPDRGTIRPGDVRLVDGVVSLVIREWDPGECWVVCPVKRLEEEISGRCVFVELCREAMGWDLFTRILTDPEDEDYTLFMGAAMPELGCTVDPEFIGKLLYRVFPQQLEECRKAFAQEFSEGGEKPRFDVDHPYSKADNDLVRLVQRKSLRKELDSSPAYVFEDDGSVRVETEKEWKDRIRRYRKAELKAEKAKVKKNKKTKKRKEE